MSEDNSEKYYRPLILETLQAFFDTNFKYDEKSCLASNCSVMEIKRNEKNKRS